RDGRIALLDDLPTGAESPPPIPGAERPRAGLTTSRRPRKSQLLSAAIAASPAASSLYSTNAKPRLRPVSRSTMMRTLLTPPCASKAFLRSSSVVVNGKLLTKRVLDAMRLPNTFVTSKAREFLDRLLPKPDRERVTGVEPATSTLARLR